MDPNNIIAYLLKDNSPLSLGFTGATMALFLWLSVYLLFSKLGWVGSGAIAKKLLIAEELLEKERALREELLEKERALRETLIVEGSAASQEMLARMHAIEIQNAKLLVEIEAEKARTEFYKTELERERKAVREWIDEIEKITGLEAKIRKLEPKE